MQHADLPTFSPADGAPGAPQGDTTTGPSAEKAAPVEPSGPLVLVVDDDLEVCAYLRMCLKPLTYRVLEATDGHEALGLIQNTPGLSLVITDVVMPRMDGIALKAAMKADPTLPPIPVLLITGDTFDKREGPILRKPFNARMLSSAVQALLPG